MKLFIKLFILCLIITSCKKELQQKPIKVFDIQYNFHCSNSSQITYTKYDGNDRNNNPIFNEYQENITSYKSISFQGYSGTYSTKIESELGDTIQVEIFVDKLLKYSKKSINLADITFNTN